MEKFIQSHKSFFTELLTVVALLSVMGFLLVFSILNESPTFDEKFHVGAGYEFLVNYDFRHDPFNPPLARELIAIPALINKGVINDPVLFWPRMVTAVFALLLGLVVYLFARKFYGKTSAVFALAFFVLDPNLLANGHYATTDLISTFFFVFAVFIFINFRKKFNLKKIIVLGIIVGFAFSTKFSNLILIPLSFAAISLLDKKLRSEVLKIKFWKRRAKSFILFAAIILISIWATYSFTMQPLLGYRFDQNRFLAKYAENPIVKFGLEVPVPLGSFVSTIKQVMVYNYAGLYEKNTYFLGNISKEGLSGFYLVPLALLKIPIPLIVIFLISLVFYKKNKNDLILLTIMFIIALATFPSKILIAMRYILPLIPFIVIYSSRLAAVKENALIIKIFLSVLILWQAVSVFSIYPHFISFYNEMAGGPKNGYKVSVDSNYDWGQGLIALSNYQKQKDIKNLHLDYFGSASPDEYGIKYKKLTPQNIENNKHETLAISATCYYFCGYYKLPFFKDKTPNEVVGGSILIFR